VTIVLFILLLQKQMLHFPLPSSQSSQVYTTLITTPEYFIGATVLGLSLKESQTDRKFVVMITKNLLAYHENIQEMRDLGFLIKVVEPISAPHKEKISAENKRWETTYTKLRTWELTEFSKVVFLDADCVVLENIDELFEEEEFAASPECCDRFNTGVFVARPSHYTLRDMLSQLSTLPSYDAADQGFLNSYFEVKWKQLPFAYNAIQNHYVNDRNAWKMDEIKVIHYVKYKPWDTKIKQKVEELDLGSLHEHWWYFYHKLKKGKRSPSM